MSKIISQKDLKNHNIQKFNFATINSEEINEKNIFKYIESQIDELEKKDQNNNQQKQFHQKITKSFEKQENNQKNNNIENKKEEIEDESENESQINQNIELLTKIEELTNQVVSLEMELEEKDKEYEQKLKESEEIAFQKGVKETKETYENQIEELKMQYISSITNLQEISFAIDEKLKKLEEELIETSIIISKKVILKELEKSSSKIAYTIATHLLDEIKEDMDIKILVNPMDYQDIKREEFNKNVKIVPDKNISKGGVIILSPKKNIDGTIKTRLKKTLQLIKEI